MTAYLELRPGLSVALQNKSIDNLVQEPKGTNMTKDRVRWLTGLVATAALIVFILGLAHSISTGFAGFWGGLPFWVISVFVLLLAAFDYWDECLRKRD